MSPGTCVPTITDTQILSYYFKGGAHLPDAPILISSITAAEFLLIQSRIPHRANYYPILPSRLRHYESRKYPGAQLPPRQIFESKRHAAFGSHRTDHLILDFGGEVPTFIEFGSVAISQIINDGHEYLFALSISHLEKEMKKKLRDRLRFLLDANVRCIAATTHIVGIGMNILAQFLDRYEAKKNPRNTINDMLILSTAIEQLAQLHTEDSLLRRFTAEVLGAECRGHGTTSLMIDFATPGIGDRRKPFESKAYINRGWQVRERRRGRQRKPTHPKTA